LATGVIIVPRINVLVKQSPKSNSNYSAKLVSLTEITETKDKFRKFEIKILNNGDIKSITNFSKSTSIAIIEFGVSYNTDLLKLQELMSSFIQEIYSKYDNIVEAPIFLGVTELADSSINMRLIAKTKTLQHYQVERDVRKDLIIYFNNNNIEIPFPQLVLHNA